MTQCDFLRVRSDFLQLTKDVLSQLTPLVKPDPKRGFAFYFGKQFLSDSNLEILQRCRLYHINCHIYYISMNRIEYYCMNRNDYHKFLSEY